MIGENFYQVMDCKFFSLPVTKMDVTKAMVSAGLAVDAFHSVHVEDLDDYDDHEEFYFLLATKEAWFCFPAPGELRDLVWGLVGIKSVYIMGGRQCKTIPISGLRVLVHTNEIWMFSVNKITLKVKMYKNAG